MKQLSPKIEALIALVLFFACSLTTQSQTVTASNLTPGATNVTYTFAYKTT